MSVLVLVRHGQASFLQSDYDKLSPLGEQQSRMLGSFWAAQGTTFDEVLTGPRNRQIRTAELTLETYAGRGPNLPAIRVVPEFDEYDSGGVVGLLLPRLVQQHQEVGMLAEEYEQSKGSAGERRAFQRMFEVVMKAWIRGNDNPPELGSWQEFQSRVLQALTSIIERCASGCRVAVFTSGGPICVAVQLALGLSDEKAIEVNWALRNGSITEFLFTKDRFTLDSFNGLPHIPDRSLWSFR
jgi:broad specificity phosphatase PhoE